VSYLDLIGVCEGLVFLGLAALFCFGLCGWRPFRPDKPVPFTAWLNRQRPGCWSPLVMLALVALSFLSALLPQLAHDVVYGALDIAVSVLLALAWRRFPPGGGRAPSPGEES